MSESVIQGIIHVVENTKTYGQNGFRKRLVVLETETGRFTNYVPLEFVHDSCDSVDGLNPGDNVEINYRLTGRKWQKDASSEVKYFLNAEAISFKVLTGSSKALADTEITTVTEDEAPEYEDGGDIPF